MRSLRNRMLALVVALVMIVAACGGEDDSSASAGGSDSAALAGEVNISGSSTVEPVSVRVAELFESVAPDAVVNVDGPGTGDGFALFCEGSTDISDASRAIKDSEAEDCAANGVEYVELQVGIDGLAVMTGAGNDLQCVSFADLYALIGPEATGSSSWADVATVAAELGSATSLPDRPLDIYGPGEESGTFDTFVEFVIEDPAEERGQDGTTRPDYNASADDNVIIRGIQSSDTSLGWVGFAFAANASGVALLEVDDGESGCIGPTADTIASGDYPLSRPLFIYVNSDAAAENATVAAYVDFYMTEGLDIAVADVGYVPLAEDVKATTRSAWG